MVCFLSQGLRRYPVLKVWSWSGSSATVVSVFCTRLSRDWNFVEVYFGDLFLYRMRIDFQLVRKVWNGRRRISGDASVSVQRITFWLLIIEYSKILTECFNSLLIFIFLFHLFRLVYKKTCVWMFLGHTSILACSNVRMRNSRFSRAFRTDVFYWCLKNVPQKASNTILYVSSIKWTLRASDFAHQLSTQRTRNMSPSL